MITTESRTPTLGKAASADGDLNDAILSYVRTYVLWHGRQRAAETLGVSRHTLWRFLEQGHVGRAVPKMLNAVGGSIEAVEAGTRELGAWQPVRDGTLPRTRCLSSLRRPFCWCAPRRWPR